MESTSWTSMLWFTSAMNEQNSSSVRILMSAFLTVFALASIPDTVCVSVCKVWLNLCQGPLMSIAAHHPKYVTPEFKFSQRDTLLLMFQNYLTLPSHASFSKEPHSYWPKCFKNQLVPVTASRLKGEFATGRHPWDGTQIDESPCLWYSRLNHPACETKLLWQFLVGVGL